MAVLPGPLPGWLAAAAWGLATLLAACLAPFLGSLLLLLLLLLLALRLCTLGAVGPPDWSSQPAKMSLGEVDRMFAGALWIEFSGALWTVGSVQAGTELCLLGCCSCASSSGVDCSCLADLA